MTSLEIPTHLTILQTMRMQNNHHARDSSAIYWVIALNFCFNDVEFEFADEATDHYSNSNMKYDRVEIFRFENFELGVGVFVGHINSDMT